LLTLRDPRGTQFTWLLHTAAGNRVELGRDVVTLVGGRLGHRCRVQIVTPWPGRWQSEGWFDHPRLRYDWFRSSLQALVVLIPYRGDDPPPEVLPSTGPGGIGLRVTRGETEDLILSAEPDASISFDGVETDAEYALVRRTKGRPARWIAAGGRTLRVGGRAFLDEAEKVPFRAG
jgi:hypothetical protein